MDHLMLDQNFGGGEPGLLEPMQKLAGDNPYGSQSLSQQQQQNGRRGLSAGEGADTAADEDQQQQEHQEEQQDEVQPELTATVAEGLHSMEERRQQLHAMMDELAQVGLHFLDQQRQQFLRIIESFKDDVDGFCRDEVSKGQQVSANTINAQERLNRAQLLVQTLGGAVCAPGLMG